MPAVTLWRLGAAAGAAVLAGALWWRTHPSACPYSQRFWVEPPHPLITRARLRDVLAPQPGERVLEVGPGTGYYTLDVASRLLPSGTLDIFDLQQEMLDHAMARARERAQGGVLVRNLAEHRDQEGGVEALVRVGQ